MAGLIYEVAWVKALGLIFGHTVYAVAIVLAVFMGGLAAGSAYFSRWRERPIATYAVLELLAGLTGALSLAGLHGVHALYIAAYPAVGGSWPLLLGIRLLGSAVVLFIPTFLLGGMFPILVSATARGFGELPSRISQLYWVNSAGALSGTLLAGFVLLPSLGLQLTIGAAVALNCFAGVLANLIRNKSSLPRTVKPHVSNTGRPPSWALLVLFGAVGCTAFAYEVAWTRLLAATIGSSTYAFTLMLAAFLAGIAVGSAVVQRFSPRSVGPSLTTISWVQVGIALTSLSSLIAFRWAPMLIPPLLRATDGTFGGLLLTQSVITALTVFPTAMFFGFNFPLMAALISGSSQTATSVGTAYAANTIGAIVGSLLTGFWLIESLGSLRVIAAVAAVHLLLALTIHLRSQRRRFVAIAIDTVLLVSLVFIASSNCFYNQPLLSLSPVLYGRSFEGRLTLAEIAATKDLVFAAEGLNDAIAVVRSDGYLALRVNGKVDASTEDIPTQLLLGHLGAAFHPNPKRVLVIGFGSGMTASAVARYPDVERIDCVEIEPAVMRAAPYLEILNRNVLADPRLHIIFDDARNFLLTSREQYDLIISEPSNPWIAGIATLFTGEYYAAARQRLRPGGSFVQWVQAYSLAPDDLRMIAGTFATHFPEVTLWRAGEPDLLLLGRTGASSLSFNRLRALWENKALREDFARLDIYRPEGLVAYFSLGDAAVRQLAHGSLLNTDDRTMLEYHAPRSLLATGLIDIDRNLIARFRQGPLPAHLDPAETHRALEAGLATALELNDPNAETFLKALASEAETSSLDVLKGRFALLEGDIPQAKALFEQAIRRDPKSADATHWLAMAEQQGGDESAALARVDQILASNPLFLPALEDQMKWAADRGDFQTALAAQMKRIALMPEPQAFEYGRLGALWIATAHFAEAESALLKGLAGNPYCYACHFELGELYLKTGKLQLARQHFQWVIRFFPDSDAAAFSALVEIDLLLKDSHSARAVLNEGLRLFPNDAALLKARAGLVE